MKVSEDTFYKMWNVVRVAMKFTDGLATEEELEQALIQYHSNEANEETLEWANKEVEERLG